MKSLRLVWANLIDNGFRSLAILTCAALVAGMAFTATFVVRGAEASLRSNLQRLGADILVLPWGTMTEKIGGVRLMSAAIDGWMPHTYLDRVAALEGVERVSPQLHLATLHDSPYRPQADLFLVAYDPATDFVLHPWLEQGLPRDLAPGEAIVGAQVVLPKDDDTLILYENPLRRVARLAPTATSIDSTVFVSLETATQILSRSQARGEELFRITPGGISALMVKVRLDHDPHKVALRILDQMHGVVPLETPDLFQVERQQMIGVLRTVLGMLGLIWALVMLFMGLVFSIAVNERRQEIGVLKALGFSQVAILKTLLLEGAGLALTGGLAGVLIALVGLVSLSDWIAQLVRLPLQLPSTLSLVSLSLGGQAAALASVTLAALIPSWRISHEEIALVMRE